MHRTTNGTGFIKERNWYGEDGMEHLRTIKEPKQSIPTFAETVTLLMKVRSSRLSPNTPITYLALSPSAGERTHHVQH